MRDESRFGKHALVRYKGETVEGGFIEDHTEGDPVEFWIGHDLIPRGFEDVLYKLPVGESCTAIIPPEEAYGYPDPAGIQVVPRSKIHGGEALHVGSHLAWKSPITNQLLPVEVVAEDEGYVKLDYNHPLAGKTLKYDIELVGLS